MFSVTSKNGEPVRAQLLTATIAECGILLANVDYIAPIITMLVRVDVAVQAPQDEFPTRDRRTNKPNTGVMIRNIFALAVELTTGSQM